MSFQVIINTSAFERSVERQIKPIMEDQLNTVTVIINEGARGPKSGRVYRGRNRASAPGESPARQTGALLASITRPDVRREGNAIVGRITIPIDYAVRLERGIGIAARPFAQPAVDEFLRRRR